MGLGSLADKPLMTELARTSSHGPAIGLDLQALASGSLTTHEAEERLRQHGPNAIAEARPKAVSLFLRRFLGVVPWMLEAAVIVDLILGKWLEAGVVATLLVGNSVMGFLQEERAQKALVLLRRRLTVNTRVPRDGAWKMMTAADLVPGGRLACALRLHG